MKTILPRVDSQFASGKQFIFECSYQAALPWPFSEQVTIKERERERERERQRETDRHTERDRERQREIDMEREGRCHQRKINNSILFRLSDHHFYVHI